MTDLVERQAVIDAIHLFFTEEIDKIPTKKTEDGEVYVIHKCQPLFEMNKALCKRIKALPSVPAEEQEPCEDSNANQHNSNALNALEGDAISRQAVLDLIEHYNSDGLGSVFYGYEGGVKFADAVNKLPPVKQEQSSSENPNEWIPVSERLPEEGQSILVTTTNGWYVVAIIRTYFKDMHKDIIAWMPLPEPYKAESDNCN